MSKLFKLKEWLTLEETAEHLTAVLGEPILNKDILRLALDGHIQLSVNVINGMQVFKGKFISINEVKTVELSETFLSFIQGLPKSCDHEPIKELVTSINLDGEKFIDLEDKVSSVDGVWDIMMLAGGQLDIEHYYQSLIGGPEVTSVAIDGAFVQRGDIVCQVLESFDENEYQSGSLAQQRKMEAFIATNNLSSDEIKKLKDDFNVKREEYLKLRKSKTDEQNYYPSGGLPSDGVLVVRTKAILDFLNLLNEGNDKPLVSKERNTLLIIIAALCKELKIDYTQRGITTAIQHLTEKIGASISDDTIRGVIKQIETAVDARSK